MKRVIFIIFAFSLLITACSNSVQKPVPDNPIETDMKSLEGGNEADIESTPEIAEPGAAQSGSEGTNPPDRKEDTPDSSESNDTKTDSDHTDISGNDTAMEDPDMDYGGYDDDFDKLFIDGVNDTAFTDRIVGRDELSKFIDEEIEPHKFEKQNLPLIYKIIQYFNIPKEIFIKYNNEMLLFNEEHGTAGTTYEEYIIDVLYCGDIEKMRQTLKSPFVLYQNQAFYTIYDLFGMEPYEIAGLGLSQEELLSYTNKVHDTMNSFGYDNEEHFRNLVKNIQSAQKAN